MAGEPRKRYYYDVKEWLMNVDDIGDTEIDALLKDATNKVICEYQRQSNGLDKIKALELVLFSHSHDYVSAGNILHYDWRTIQNWVTSFVYDVAEKAGYEGEEA